MTIYDTTQFGTEPLLLGINRIGTKKGGLIQDTTLVYHSSFQRLVLFDYQKTRGYDGVGGCWKMISKVFCKPMVMVFMRN